MVGGDDIVFVDESSPNIDKILPWEYVISSPVVYKVDTIGRRLNKRALNLQSIGNFMDSR
jgi:hypothetical protein